MRNKKVTPHGPGLFGALHDLIGRLLYGSTKPAAPTPPTASTGPKK